jgi:D-arabinose 1-dehydrogenase-like Zn-dependent alcohol dehydrogenase
LVLRRLVHEPDVVLRLPAITVTLTYGNITLVGAPDKPLPVSAFGLIFGRRSLSGSPIGGVPETREMLDFCGARGITAAWSLFRSKRSTRLTSGWSSLT